ncbi:hypothetical protein OTU49_003920 [Cherax quadricarinatus]|uniref:H15 domain-containing protein n=1 Tax=Cherax quadricarinatus TaxID=27406 RepID=A0AAW0XEU1_CHEQU|nr:histone H1-delta-like [Cherax quadricarinatus]
MADTAATTTPAAAKKTSKKVAKKAVAHPKYSAMIAAAIASLKERNGSSRQAILKYIVANYKIEEKAVATQLKHALKRGVSSGALKQVKGAGASGSFRINKPEDSATPKKPAAKKTVAKKPAPKKATTPKKPAAKKVAKKSAAKVTTPKKPAAKKATKKPTPKKTAKKPVAKKVAKKTTKK